MINMTHLPDMLLIGFSPGPAGAPAQPSQEPGLKQPPGGSGEARGPRGPRPSRRPLPRAGPAALLALGQLHPLGDDRLPADDVAEDRPEGSRLSGCPATWGSDSPTGSWSRWMHTTKMNRDEKY